MALDGKAAANRPERGPRKGMDVLGVRGGRVSASVLVEETDERGATTGPEMEDRSTGFRAISFLGEAGGEVAVAAVDMLAGRSTDSV